MNFYIALARELMRCIPNDYNDNWDYYRFGPEPNNKIKIRPLSLRKIKNAGYDVKFYTKYLNWLYNSFCDAESKKLLVLLTAYRILGYKKVKLPPNTHDYFQKIISHLSMINPEDYIEVLYERGHKKKLYRFELHKKGFPIKLYSGEKGFQVLFVDKQYEYKNKDILIKADKGDVVFDCGACWGNTALYFANEVGEMGKVISFEFIPGNIDVFNEHMSINKDLQKTITLVKQPLGKVSGEKIYYSDNGPGSKVSIEKFSLSEGECETITIDDYVRSHNLNKVDYIKMDIEGAELMALKGTINTIKKYKPKLGISVYHGVGLYDIINITRFIDTLNLGYRFYLGHATIHKEETVLFGTIYE